MGCASLTTFILLVVINSCISNGNGPINPAEDFTIRRPVFVVISFDGFRYDYFEKVDTPNLNWIKENGVSAPYMKPQFPTVTFANHQSIATGLHTESHGVVSQKVFDPLFNRTLTVADELFWVYDPLVVPLWVLNEWNGGISGTMMWPGSEFKYGENKTKSTHSVAYNSSVPFESRIDTVLTWLSHPINPANLIFMYFEQPDNSAHAFGTDSSHVMAAIAEMDKVTGYFVQKLKDADILDHINLIFLSDHGFESVTPNHIINLSTMVSPTRYTETGGEVAYYYVLPKPNEDVDTLYEDLKAASVGHNFSVYKKTEIPKEKPHWFCSASRRTPPIILSADLGYAFDDTSIKRIFETKPSSVIGKHGYDNELPPMFAYFRAIGPAFKSGMEVEGFDNIDLFPLLCHLFGIPTPPNNGTIKKTEALLMVEGLTAETSTGQILGLSILVTVALKLFLVLALLMRRKWRRRGYAAIIIEPSVEFK